MPGLNQRTLKIEAVGDFAACKVRPLIRLRGCWLDRAGFKPGHRVAIRHLKPGELTLQFEEAAPEPTNPPTQPF